MNNGKSKNNNSQSHKAPRGNPLFDSLLEAYDYINATQDTEKVIIYLVDKLSVIFKANKVSFMLLDEVKQELSVKASLGLAPEASCGKTKVGESFSGWVAKEVKPLLVRDVQKEYPQLMKNRLGRYTTKSFMVAPVRVRDNVLGVFNVTDKKEEDVFTEEDLKLLNLISAHLALHIENSRLLDKNKSLCDLDSATGLFNHCHFFEELSEEIYRAERYHRALSVIVLDIDDFSAYNRNYGYTSGDNVLKQISRIIKENTRKVDTASRYGGEEFAIILPETKLKEAVFAGEKIRERINSAIFTDSESRNSSFGMTRFTVSAGVAEHKIGLSKEELMQRATVALQEAKKQGKNRLCVFK